MNTYNLLKQIKLAILWRANRSKFKHFYCFMPNVNNLYGTEEDRNNIEDTPLFVKVAIGEDSSIEWVKDYMYGEFSLYPYSVTSTPYCKILTYNTDFGKIIILLDYCKLRYSDEEFYALTSKLGIHLRSLTKLRELSRHSIIDLPPMEKLVYSSIMDNGEIRFSYNENKIIVGLVYASEAYLFSRKYRNADEILVELKDDPDLFENFKASMSDDFKSLIKSLR